MSHGDIGVKILLPIHSLLVTHFSPYTKIALPIHTVKPSIYGSYFYLTWSYWLHICHLSGKFGLFFDIFSRVVWSISISSDTAAISLLIYPRGLFSESKVCLNKDYSLIVLYKPCLLYTSDAADE